ncbi:MAG: tetratricopeptide repeat protein [Bacteroidota bacterium]|nr:tetratricopeptide repeat protein [Bacteroidota bacterium]
MKKKTIYIICIAIFCIAVIGIIIKYNVKEKEKENMVYELLPRKGAAANSNEWKLVQKKAETLFSALKEDPNDLSASLKLAALYIQEARETGNYMYYDKAAMKSVNTILKIDSLNFNALVYKSLIYLSQHHFAEGLAAAQKARSVNPYNAYVYGLMVDGNVEMGNYDSAVAQADKMVSIRPDLTSYSRVSYLREIFGNYKSSIEAMKMAAGAGGQGDEHTEWTRVQLGNLYEKTGDYKTAEGLYNLSLSMRPDYPYALAGLARVAVAANDTKKAIALYEKADSLINDNSMKEELVDLYRQSGQNKKADEIAKAVIEDLSKDANAGDKDESIGHYADRELAYAYLKVHNTDKALEHALLEYNRRPENIDVNETVAWVYYNKGEYDKALPYIKTALKTNSKNPVLLSRAGLIFLKSGEKEMAKTMLQQASVANSYVGYTLKAETSTAMQNL